MTEKEILQLLLEKVTNIEFEQQAMKTEQHSMKDMLSSQGDHIQQLIKIVGTTNSHLEEIKDTQQEQQRVLEKLSYRSITQESDIADLKRIK